MERTLFYPFQEEDHRSRRHTVSPWSKKHTRTPSPRPADRHQRWGYSPSLSPTWNGEEEEHRDPLSRAILETPLLVDLEKPPSRGIYDGTTVLNEHIENISSPRLPWSFEGDKVPNFPDYTTQRRNGVVQEPTNE